MGKWNSKSQLAALVTARKQKLSATHVNGAENRGTTTSTGNCPCGVCQPQCSQFELLWGRWGRGGAAVGLSPFLLSPLLGVSQVGTAASKGHQ